MVTSLLQFLKAERTRNWKLDLSSIAAMLPHNFAMDRQNYARLFPVYLADMQRLELTHPDVYNDFAAANHSLHRSHCHECMNYTWMYVILHLIVGQWDTF